LCSHNGELAIKNRITNEVVEDLGEWEKVIIGSMALHNGFNYRFLKPTPFNEWVSRFPPSRKAQLVLAQDKVRKNVSCIDATVSAFVKQESYYAKDNFTPRLIQGRHDTFLSVMGPAMHAIGNEMKRVWNKGHYIVYTSGLTAEDLGEVFSLFADVPEPPVWFEFDMGRFDGRQGAGARKYDQTEIHKYEFVRMNAFWARALRHCLKKTGYTFGYMRDGIYFFYRLKRQSGDAHTSSSNSDLDVGVVSHCLT
jgi:hypothetical protein